MPLQRVWPGQQSMLKPHLYVTFGPWWGTVGSWVTVFWIQQRKAPTRFEFLTTNDRNVSLTQKFLLSAVLYYPIKIAQKYKYAHAHFFAKFNLNNVLKCCCSRDLIQKMKVNTKEIKFYILIPVLLVLSTHQSKSVIFSTAVRSKTGIQLVLPHWLHYVFNSC